jgi:hypothetical protein
MRIARVFAIFLCLLLTITASGESPAGSNWQRVKQLPLHTRVHVSADGKSRACSIDSVDDDTLNCGHHTFQRSSIKSIKLTRYLVSTAVGAGIGGGAGAAAGEAAFNGNGFVHGGQAAAVLGGLFAVVGGGIGLGTDFARGPTIYRRQ